MNAEEKLHKKLMEAVSIFIGTSYTVPHYRENRPNKDVTFTVTRSLQSRALKNPWGRG